MFSFFRYVAVLFCLDVVCLGFFCIRVLVGVDIQYGHVKSSKSFSCGGHGFDFGLASHPLAEQADGIEHRSQRGSASC